MRKNLLSLTFLVLVCCLFTTNVWAQDCPAEAGEPVAPLTQYCLDGSNVPDDLIVTEYVVEPSGDDFSVEYVITDPDGGILEVTEWSYAGSSDSGGFDIEAAGVGTYTFTGFVFRQSELDAISGNPLVGPIIGAVGGESLSELLTLIKNQTVIDVPDPLTIEAVLGVLNDPTVTALIGFTPCVDVSDVSFTVEAVESCAPAVPENNEFFGALPLDLPAAEGDTLTYGPYDNSLATNEATDPTPPDCFGEPGFSEDPILNNSLWFTVTGDGGSYYMFTSSDCADGPLGDAYLGDGDTQIAVYVINAEGGLEEVACNEDAADAVTGNYFAGVSLETEAGVLYYIMIDGFSFDGSLSSGQFCLKSTVLPTCDDLPVIELSADQATEVSACYIAGAGIGINQETLNIGGDLADHPQPTIVLAIGTADPAGGNPREADGYLGFWGSDTLPASSPDGTDPFGVGVTSFWVTPIIAGYNEADDNYSFGTICPGYATESVLVTFVAAGEGDCPALCDIVEGDAGALATDSETTVCVDDGEDDMISVIAEGANDSVNYTYIITNEDLEILDIRADGVFNVEGAGAGTCLIWGIAFTGDLAGAEVGANANDITGCFAITDAIAVIRLTGDDCPSEGTSTSTGAVTGATTGTETVTVTTGTSTGTDTGGVSTSTGAVTGASTGTETGGTSTSTGASTGTETGGTSTSTEETCDLEEGAAGTIATDSETIFCTDDDAADIVDVAVEGADENADYSFVITDEDGNILAGPFDSGPFDFDGVPAGTCLIWGVASIGDLVLADNAADIEGCFVLSNAIAVTRLTEGDCPDSCDVDGGEVGTDSQTTFCVGDGNADVIVAGNSGSGASYTYIITDNTGNVLATVDGPDMESDGFDFNQAPSGVCLIYGVAHDGDIEIGATIDDVSGECFDVSDNSIAVTRAEPISISTNVVCDDASGEFSVEVSISGGLPSIDDNASYSVSGDVSTDQAEFSIGPLSDGQGYTILVEDDLGCSAEEVSGPVACTKCGNNPGAMPGAGNPDATIYVCDGAAGGATAAGVSLDEGSVLVYALHTSPDATAGDILAINGTGTFSFSDLANGSTNTTYYISSVVGPDEDGDGIPDLGNSCTLIAPGSPIVFLNPIIITIEVIPQNDNGDCKIANIEVSVSGGLPEALGEGTYTLTGTLLNDVTFVYNGTPIFVPGILIDEVEVITATDGAGCSATIDGIIFTAADCAPTPIDLISYTGEVLNTGNLLKWVTATETNNDYFLLERSADQTNFETIATIDGNGTTDVLSNYEFLDKDAPNGTAYYRLTQIDFDGTSVAVGIVPLTRGERFGITAVRPIPADYQVEVQFDANEAAEVIANVYNAAGKLVHTSVVPAQAGLNNFSLDVSAYSTGTYFLSLSDGKTIITDKLMVK